MAQTAYQFFLKHAGYSVNPGETQIQGRRRSARELARAEQHASSMGVSFHWEVDDLDSSEWSDEEPPYPQWCCVARTADGKVFASLCGIDFGRDSEPWGDPYRRVVEADLATELSAGQVEEPGVAKRRRGGRLM
jgi:hypothetical protein